MFHLPAHTLAPSAHARTQGAKLFEDPTIRAQCQTHPGLTVIDPLATRTCQIPQKKTVGTEFYRDGNKSSFFHFAPSNEARGPDLNMPLRQDSTNGADNAQPCTLDSEKLF